MAVHTEDYFVRVLLLSHKLSLSGLLNEVETEGGEASRRLKVLQLTALSISLTISIPLNKWDGGELMRMLNWSMCVTVWAER